LGNEKLLLMAFNKLIENSYQHGRFDKTLGHMVSVQIKIRSASHADQWVIELLDNGDGYSSDIISTRMYEQEAGLSDGGNLGLGLRITEAIIAHHSGTTIFRNGSNNRGALTVIRLPKHFNRDVL